MKKFVINLTGLFAPALLAIAPLLLRAQGTLYFSNLGQTSASSTAIGSDFWIAQAFLPSLGPNFSSFELNSVQLLINSTSGSATGLNVSIYSGMGSRSPQLFLGDLNFSSSVDGVYTYTASGITLARGTTYFMVATATTPVATGAYSWSVADTLNHDGAWLQPTHYYSSNDGSNWHGPLYNSMGNGIFQFAIYATPVPEPSAISFIFLGGGVLFYVRKRKCSH